MTPINGVMEGVLLIAPARAVPREGIDHRLTRKSFGLKWNRVFVLGIALGIGVLASLKLVSNPYTFGIFRGDPAFVTQEPVRNLLSLTAGYFYLLPIFVALLMAGGNEERTLTSAQEVKLFVRIQSRVLVSLVIAGLPFLVAALIVGIKSFGSPGVGRGFWTRVLLTLGLIEIFALSLAYLFGIASLFRRSSRERLVANFVVLGILVVGIPLISDQILFYSVGVMPTPGSVEWFRYLERSASNAGTLIYLFSPMETFLSVTTRAVQQVALTKDLFIESYVTSGAQVLGLALLFYSLGLFLRRRKSPNS